MSISHMSVSVRHVISLSVSGIYQVEPPPVTTVVLENFRQRRGDSLPFLTSEPLPGVFAVCDDNSERFIRKKTVSKFFLTFRK